MYLLLSCTGSRWASSFIVVYSKIVISRIIFRVACMCRIKINCLIPNMWFESELLCLVPRSFRVANEKHTLNNAGN